MSRPVAVGASRARTSASAARAGSGWPVHSAKVSAVRPRPKLERKRPLAPRDAARLLELGRHERGIRAGPGEFCSRFVPGNLGGPVGDTLLGDDRPRTGERLECRVRVAQPAERLGAHALVDREVLGRADLLHHLKALADALQAMLQPAGVDLPPAEEDVGLGPVLLEVVALRQVEQLLGMAGHRGAVAAVVVQHEGDVESMEQAADMADGAGVGQRLLDMPAAASPAPSSQSTSAVSPSAQTLQSWPP
jgi:hypothetical protein